MPLCFPLAAVHSQVIHKRPSREVRSAGRDLPWEKDLDKALALAAKSKRPVLWYVPTVPGSPMDRKTVLDLYMRAGIFCDPGLRALFAHYVLLEHVPDRKEAVTYDLRPFRFIEPGFLILDGKGKVLDRCSGMSSFPYPWLERRFASHLDRKLVERIRAKTGKSLLRSKLAEFAIGHYNVEGLENSQGAWPSFLRACVLFETGKKEAARKAWSRLAKQNPGTFLAARAQAEAEGFGPIVRGFWTWTDARAGSPLDLPGTTWAAGSKDVGAIRKRAIEVLLRLQEDNGGYEDSNYDFGGQDSVPNVHVAVTALAVMAFLRHRASLSKADRKLVHKSIEYVLDPANRNPADKDEWSWARLYALHMCGALLDTQPDDDLARRLRQEATLCSTDLLARQQSGGSFRHEYSNPFVTASVLLALKDARRLGFDVDSKQLDKALTALEKARTKLGAFTYMQPRGKARASLVAAAGRMPLCESALFAFGRSSREQLRKALEVSFANHEQLESTRKYDDHANRHAYGGFFYWYDQLGRRMAMDLLGKESQDFHKRQQVQILAIPEIDGSFVDSHELGKSYGTAMALLCLDPAQEDQGRKDQDK